MAIVLDQASHMSITITSSHHLARGLLVGLLVSSGIALQGCCRTEPVAAATAEPAIAPLTTLTIPDWTNEGSDREVEVLMNAGGLKVAAIALRRGTELPVHSVDSRVSISVLRGAGTMTVDGQAIAVAAGSVLVLGPAVAHAMTPSGQELVVLLVHYLDAPDPSHTETKAKP